jgi:D-sedoheptulose 7-phosphate isomerase
VTGTRPAGLPTGTAHVGALVATLTACGPELTRTTQRWGRELADRLPRGHRLLVAGNGGSAAQAQHLTAELVGRYRDDRPPLSALALHAETSTLTAVLNDYGAEEVYARQVTAHGRAGDVLVLLSTSGRSPNVLYAAQAGRAAGLTVWAMTGRGPNPLAGLAAESLVVDGPSTATVQEVHLVALHLLCAAFDVALGVCPETLLAAGSRRRTR